MKKQRYNIDLWVDVELFVNGEEQRHAVLIENKAYSPLHDAKDEDGESRCQLEVYRKKFDREYCTKNTSLNYILITCHEDEDYLKSLQKTCDEYNFKVYSVTDLQSIHDQDTESDIFNKF